jgi:hypothetical protein
MPAQPYHAAVGLDMADAEKLVSRAERDVQEAAIAGLRAVADGRPAGSVVSSVAVVVKALSLPTQLADVLRSHARMHAAEGVLYREAVLAAARDRGYLARAVEASVLPAAVDAVETLGRAAGRPWRRIEKDAARAAITLLPKHPAVGPGTPEAAGRRSALVSERGPSVQAVAAELPCSRSHAGRLVAQARPAGHLRRTSPGRASATELQQLTLVEDLTN